MAQVSRQMGRMKDAISQPQPLAVRRQSVALLGVLSGVAGQLAMDLDRPDRADGMFSVGRLAATEAGDDDLAAWVAATQSIGPFFGQQYGAAAELLADAERLAANASSPRRRAWTAAMHARALAASGQRRPALAALDRAHAHITAELDQQPHGTDFFDAPRLDGVTGSVYLLLREPGRAADFIGRALTRARRQTTRAARYSPSTWPLAGSSSARTTKPASSSPPLSTSPPAHSSARSSTEPKKSAVTWQAGPAQRQPPT